MVKKRLSLMTDETCQLSSLKVWGKWLPQPAPPIGDATLMRMVKEMQPLLLIIDPLRDAHSAEENDSGEMKQVMDHLRTYSSLGTAICGSVSSTAAATPYQHAPARDGRSELRWLPLELRSNSEAPNSGSSF